MALDGNAIGGLLLEIFGSDMTSAEASCAACGAVGPVAKTTVPPGAGNGRPLQQMHERAYGRRAGPRAELRGTERRGRAGSGLPPMTDCLAGHSLPRRQPEVNQRWRTADCLS
jgi:hypothetical protein